MKKRALYYHALNNLRLFLKSRRYRGTALCCPVCEFTAASFLPSPDGKRVNVRCPRCDSLERHRAQWLFGLQALSFTREKKITILHVTPEHCITARLLEQFPHARYRTSTFPKSSGADYSFDVQQIPLPDKSVDVIICNHVLEHVPDDRRALAEVYRILTDGGYAFLQVPLDAAIEKTDEDPAVATPEQRRLRFGQEDHVRQYGMDFTDRLLGAGFTVTVNKFWETMAPDECKRYAVTDREPVIIGRK